MNKIPVGATRVASQDGSDIIARSPITGHAHVLKCGPQVLPRPRRGDKPSSEAILEGAFSLANEAMFTIAMQCRRMRSPEPEDDDFAFRWWSDLLFLIIALRRLSLAATVARKARTVSLDADIKNFDNALPSLPIMRNTGEHVDEYAVDSSRRKKKGISRRQFHVGSWDGTTFSWLDGELNIDSARLAAEQLFAAIRRERDEFIVRGQRS